MQEELLKLCVAGAAEAEFCGVKAFEKAKKLGKEIIWQGGILMNGATGGFPTWSAIGAKEANGQTLGFSPAGNKDEHMESYGLPTKYFDHIIYTGLGASGTNIILTRSVEAVFVGCGRIGTVHEFIVAYEERKPIGILEGEWKTDEIIANIIEYSNLEQDKIVIDNDPSRLVESVVELVKKDRTQQQELVFEKN